MVGLIYRDATFQWISTCLVLKKWICNFGRVNCFDVHYKWSQQWQQGSISFWRRIICVKKRIIFVSLIKFQRGSYFFKPKMSFLKVYSLSVCSLFFWISIKSPGGKTVVYYWYLVLFTIDCDSNARPLWSTYRQEFSSLGLATM